MGALIHTLWWLIHTGTPGRKPAEFWRIFAPSGLVRVQHLAEGPDVPAEVVVLGHLALDLLAAVEDGGVVAAAESLADTHERRLGLLAHEVHRDLAREDDLLVAGLAAELFGRHAVVPGDGLDDAVGGQRLLTRVVEDVLEHLLGELGRHRHRAQRCVRDDARERSFELADVRHDPLCEEVDHGWRDGDSLRLSLRAEDRDARLEIGCRDIRDEAPLEPRAQTIFEPFDGLGRTIAREDDLLPLLMDRIEGVEELLLRPLLAREELDVVDEEDIDAAIALAELLALLSADRVDELVRELLTRRVCDALLRMTRDHGVPDRVHEVCLPETGSAVDEERVVAMAWALG